MEKDYREYKDEVVFDLLNFLDQYGNSEDKKDTWYSEIPHGSSTHLYDLFDKDQVISFSGVIFSITDRNKLLMITSYADEFRTFFGFNLEKNANTFKFKYLTKKDGTKILRLTNDNGINIDLLALNEKNKKMKKGVYLKDLVKPVSFEQLYERGIKPKTK